MAKRLKLDLPSADDLFTTQQERDEGAEEKVIRIKNSQISDFPNHPFQVRQDEAMTAMIDSIKEYGILVPALVRPKEDGEYEMVSGHRRKFGGEQAGLTETPCIVRNLTNDEAIVIMVDSNLQREKILPSEKAFAYKMKLEAIKRQGHRTDLETSRPLGEKFLSIEELRKEGTDSARQIHRYIRLTELIKPILDLVDSNKIAFRPAVELSYLPEEQQIILFDTMECEDCTPSLAQAIKMKNFEREGRLSEDVMLSILSEEKPNQKEQFRIPQERINKYFPSGTPKKQMEDTIIKALEMYRKRQKTIER